MTDIEKYSPDAPRLEMIKFIKVHIKDAIGFSGVAQLGKSSPDSPRLE